MSQLSDKRFKMSKLLNKQFKVPVIKTSQLSDKHLRKSQLKSEFTILPGKQILNEQSSQNWKKTDKHGFWLTQTRCVFFGLGDHGLSGSSAAKNVLSLDKNLYP